MDTYHNKFGNFLIVDIVTNTYVTKMGFNIIVITFPYAFKSTDLVNVFIKLLLLLEELLELKEDHYVSVM